MLAKLFALGVAAAHGAQAANIVSDAMTEWFWGSCTARPEIEHGLCADTDLSSNCPKWLLIHIRRRILRERWRCLDNILS